MRGCRLLARDQQTKVGQHTLLKEPEPPQVSVGLEVLKNELFIGGLERFMDTRQTRTRQQDWRDRTALQHSPTVAIDVLPITVVSHLQALLNTLFIQKPLLDSLGFVFETSNHRFSEVGNSTFGMDTDSILNLTHPTRDQRKRPLVWGHND
ncbi:unnamed protein product [Dovyalis caffra]|uniref:Uncharacterized protein n=1 Tax=Dovyalis caffra TaxID=77055 RepID=A0AAV1RZ03_9ROSI|nr:unnamed protein product [Dovyalis caffra]